MAHITSYLSTIFEDLQRATVEKLRMDEANEGTNFHNDYSVRYVPLISICSEQIIANYNEYIKPVPTPAIGSDRHDSDNDDDDKPNGRKDKRPKSWYLGDDKVPNLNTKSDKSDTDFIKKESKMESTTELVDSLSISPDAEEMDTWNQASTDNKTNPKDMEVEEITSQMGNAFTPQEQKSLRAVKLQHLMLKARPRTKGKRLY